MVENPPVRFRRSKAILPLPEPVIGGSVNALRQFVNVGDADWPLFLAALLAAYRPGRPYPILNLHGEQGSAKTTTARMFRGLIDPNTAPVRAEPREPRDLMIAANNGLVVALDNLSHIPAWLSAGLCRLSTGGGFSTRTLYENDEETVFDAMRPVVVNGIEEVATRSDPLTRLKLAAGIGDKDKPPYGWPRDGTRLSGILKRLAPNLRQVGIDVQSGRTGRRRTVTLIRTEAELSVTNVTTVTTPKTPSKTAERVTLSRPRRAASPPT